MIALKEITKDLLSIEYFVPAIGQAIWGMGLICPEALSSAFVSLESYYREFKVSWLWRMRN